MDLTPGRREGTLDETALTLRFAMAVHVHAAALYVAMIKNGFFDEATEFAEWYLDTFDHDLET